MPIAPCPVVRKVNRAGPQRGWGVRGVLVGLRLGDTCPVAAVKELLALSEITRGPLFRKVNRGGMVEAARLSAVPVRQILLKRAARAGLKGTLAEPVSRMACAPGS